MSALTLKIIAVITMLIDHIGAVTGEPMLRVVGRLSLPIFAFLIANGFRHTRSVKKYMLRLFAFAVISEIPFDLFVSAKISIVSFGGLLPNLELDNIFFTLFLGLAFLYLNDLYKKKGIKYAGVLSTVTFCALGSVAAFISADYGVVGVAWVALFGIFDVSEKRNAAPLAMGSVLLGSWHVIAKNFANGILNLTAFNLSKIPVLSYFFNSTRAVALDRLQIVSAAAVILILFYNGKSGMPKSRIANNIIKYSFYAFYPVHLLILYFIAYHLL